MNSYKIVFLSFCFLIGTKFNYLAAKLIGLRCEYNGTMEFAIKKGTVDFIEKERMGCEHYDSLSLGQIEIGKFSNGCVFYQYKLFSNQWVLLDDEIFICISLIPNSSITVFNHDDVYFYNIFSHPLIFKLGRVCYETKLKENLFIINDIGEWIKLADFNSRFNQYDQNYQIILPPGYALKYPVESGVTITLEIYGRK